MLFFNPYYRVTLKECDFNDDRTAYIQFYFNKLWVLQWLIGHNYVSSIVHQRLQGFYKKKDQLN